MKWICPLWLLILLWLPGLSQTRRDAVREQFIPREVVIFSEDFSGYEVGSNPANWGWMGTDPARPTPGRTQWPVERTDSNKNLSVKTAFFFFYPEENLAHYMRDSFTMSCQFQLATTFAESDIILRHKNDSFNRRYWNNNPFASFSISRIGALHTHIGVKEETLTKNELTRQIIVDHPVSFDTAAWHHLGVWYKKGQLKVYLDSFLMLNEPNYRYSIDTILFGGWATVKYRNIKIATGPAAEPVRQLLHGRTLSTHAILFDVASATIKPGSYAFLNELVEVLKSRMSLKLEICGHTDSDGSDADNLALSERRAGAVRDYPVGRGIAVTRLTLRGYGESKPLRTGNSEQDKATNRRVEFVPK